MIASHGITCCENTETNMHLHRAHFLDNTTPNLRAVTSHPSQPYVVPDPKAVMLSIQVKVKVTLEQATKCPDGEQMYSSTLPSTSTLGWGVGGQRHAPAALPPAKARYPLYGKLGGPRGRSGRVRKISPPTGIRSSDRPTRSESLYRLGYPGPCY